jgi:hypothetical protein
MKRFAVALAAFLFTSVAFAAEVGRLPAGEHDVVTFHDEQGSICPEGTFAAFYIVGNSPEAQKAGMAGAVIPGCWLYRSPNVHVQFVDGDGGAIKRDAITWVAGKKPALHTL